MALFAGYETMNILEKLKLQQVKRFPICFTNRDQSVAEHSFNVAMIAAELAKATGDEKFRADCIEYALHHDLEEVYTGDIPSSFKRHLIQHVPAAKPLISDPTEVDPTVKATVKLADHLEAIYYLTEFGGSREARLILTDITKNMAKFSQDHAGDIPSRVKQRTLEVMMELQL